MNRKKLVLLGAASIIAWAIIFSFSGCATSPCTTQSRGNYPAGGGALTDTNGNVIVIEELAK